MAQAREAIIDVAVKSLFARTEETKFLTVSLRSGRQEALYFGDLASGALIDNIVQRSKEMAIKRAIAGGGDEGAGLRAEDLVDAIKQEYRENEVFPPSDSVEDWLRLLDYDPENVVRVAPTGSPDDRTQAAAATGNVV